MKHTESESRNLAADITAHPSRWQKLKTGGSTNEHYSGWWHNQEVVVRLNAGPELAFGASRINEFKVLQVIQPFRWAVKVLENRPEQGWCMMSRYLELDSEEVSQQQINSFLGDMQQIIDIPVFDYRQMIKKYQCRIVGAESQKLIEQLALLVDELPDKAFCLVHHDLHPGNLMWGHVQENVSDRDHCNNQEKPGKYQFKVIDWEYAGKGCPWLDIAMVCRYWNQSADQILRAELPVTRGKTLAQVSEVLNLAGQVNTLIEKLWLAVRQETES